jgi:hypothetical protein
MRCSHCGAAIKNAPRPNSSNTVLLIALAVVALFIAGFGGLAAWMIVNRPSSSAIADEAPSLPAKDEEPDEVPSLTTPFDSKQPKKKELDPRFKKAVDAGVGYLRSVTPARDQTFAKRDHGLGMAALSGLTMLECGVPTGDEDVQALAKVIRDNMSQLTSTYTAAPAILFLDRLHKDKSAPDDDKKRIQTLALRLIAAQKSDSALWSYVAPPLGKTAGEVKNRQFELITKLRADVYVPAGVTEKVGDLSNTQFAALALWAARRHGVPVDPALRAAARTMRSGQNKAAGTWVYHLTEGAHPDSATCVGLILLALGRAVADDKNADKTPIVDDPAVASGLKHLGKIVGKDAKERKAIGKAKAKAKGKVMEKPLGAKSGGDLYFLWALERTALILNIETIAGVNWHAWGSEIILENQKPGGDWQDKHPGVPDTCFALLFLTQGNLFQDLTDKLTSIGQESGGQPAVSAPPKQPGKD